MSDVSPWRWLKRSRIGLGGLGLDLEGSGAIVGHGRWMGSIRGPTCRSSGPHVL